ncbi:hypothetical protein PG993_011884 [Apiospora rasikravindrae]|uniref:Uncharacterized protein n=1 Tax=Apiospora rasikravindrae TaxID=990691 RepID=A0ABR1S114_9PEZI
MQIITMLASLLLGAAVLGAPLSKRNGNLEPVEYATGSLNTEKDNAGGTGFATKGFGIHTR